MSLNRYASSYIQIKRRRTYQLASGAYLDLGWHHGKRCFVAEIYVEGRSGICAERKRVVRIAEEQTRFLWAANPKDLFRQIRLALAQGTNNIYWDVAIMHRLTR
jgi:hypothetical protein